MALIRILFPLVLVLIALPFAAVLIQAMGGSQEDWLHFANTLLPHYIYDTLTLILGVTIASALIGVSLAWGCYQSPIRYRRWFVWALMLPLCFPSYILAYLYTDILQVGGWVHTTFAPALQISPQQWPEIRSLGGAIFVFSISLYPYVFLPVYANLTHSAPTLLDAAATLGHSRRSRFFRIAFPLLLPSLLSGSSLIAMEVMNDFGTTQYFAINTLVTGVFRAWTGLGSLATASQIALLGLILATAFTQLLFWSQTRRAFFEKPTPQNSQKPSQGKNRFFYLFFILVFLCGFGIPTFVLLSKATNISFIEHTSSLKNSLMLMSVAALTAFSLALAALYFALEKTHGSISRIVRFLIQFGYAVPGTIIALGVLMVVNFIPGKEALGWTTLAIVGLCYAYSIRFAVVPFQLIEGALQKLPSNILSAARVLGLSSKQTWFRVILPALKRSVFASFILLAIDIGKDLSIAIILRPFQFDTLPIDIYLTASDERLGDAAFPALFLVSLGALSLVLMLESLHESA